MALVDTNSDPDEVQFPIPANDDAIRAVRLIASKMADAVIEGAMARESAMAESRSDEGWRTWDRASSPPTTRAMPDDAADAYRTPGPGRAAIAASTRGERADRRPRAVGPLSEEQAWAAQRQSTGR